MTDKSFSMSGAIKLSVPLDNPIKDAAKLADNLGRAQTSAEKLGKTGKSAIDRGTKGVTGQEHGGPGGGLNSKDYRTERSAGSGRGAKGREFSGLASEGGSVVAAYATIAATMFAVTAGFQAMSKAAEFEQLAAGLDLVGARAGVNLGAVTKGLKEITDGALSTAESMRVVASATAAGFSGDEINRLATVAKGASVALGRDMSDSLDRLTRGTIKLEPELLDELGIMTRLDEAVKTYALANNKAVSAMTNTERRQAFLNAVLAEGERKFGDIAEQVDINPYNKLSAAMRELGTEILGVVNGYLEPLVKLFTQIPQLGVVAGLSAITSALSKVTPSLTSIIQKSAGVKKGLEGIKGSVTEDIAHHEMLLSDLALEKETTKTITERRVIEADITRLRAQETAIGRKINAENRKRGSISIFQEEIKSKGRIGATGAFAGRELEAFTDAFDAGKGGGIVSGFKAAGSAAMTFGRVAASALGTITIYITLALTALKAAQAIWAWLNPPSELDKKIEASKKNIKELGERAEKTAEQVAKMLEPGKGQAGLAYDAITTSISAMNDEMQTFLRLEEQRAAAEKAFKKGTGGVKVSEAATPGVGKAPIKSAVVGEGVITEAEAYERIKNTLVKTGKLKDEQANQFITTMKLRNSALTEEERQTRLQSFFRQDELETKKLLLRASDEGLSIAERTTAWTLANLGVQQNALEIEARNNMLAEVRVATFKDLAEVTKDISKNAKELFPKDKKDPLKDLSVGYGEILKLVKDIKETSADGLDKAFNRGVATEIADQYSSMKDILIVLKAQNREVAFSKGFEESINTLQKARIDLIAAQKTGKAGLISAAGTLVDNAELEVAQQSKLNEQAWEQLQTELLILSATQSHITGLLEINKQKQKIAKMDGKTLKTILETANVLQNNMYAATGADFKVPEEASIEYRLELARVEQESAEKVAKIQKEVIQLESKQQALTLQNALAVSRSKGVGYSVGLPAMDDVARTFLTRNSDGALKSQKDMEDSISNIKDSSLQLYVIEAYRTALLEEQVSLGGDYLASQLAQLDAELASGDAKVGGLKAEKEGYQQIASIAMRAAIVRKKEIEAHGTINGLLQDRNNLLFPGVAIATEAANVLNQLQLPGLENEQKLLKNKLALEDALILKVSSGNDLDKKAKLEIYRQNRNATASELAAIDEKVKTIEEVNKSLESGLLFQREALALRIKELDAIKEVQSASATLRNSEVALSKSASERNAREQNRPLSEVENQLNRGEQGKAELLNALDARDMLIAEHALKMETIKLERDMTIDLYTVQMEVARAALQYYGKTEEQIATTLAPMGASLEKFKTSGDKQSALSDQAFGYLLKAADNGVATIANNYSDVLTTSVGSMFEALIGPGGKIDVDKLGIALEHILDGQSGGFRDEIKPTSAKDILETNISNLIGKAMKDSQETMQTAKAGFGMNMLGAGAEFQGLVAEAGKSHTDGIRGVLNDPELVGRLQATAKEMKYLNIQAEGLDNISTAIGEGFTTALQDIADGTSTVSQAFGNMAISILKAIQEMIIKMLVFKAIEAGMNMLVPGSGTLFAAVAPKADGGIMGYANGGIASRGLSGVVTEPTYLVGEGRQNEAVVPLPNGRSIPVQMQGSSGGTNNVSVNINMTDSGTQKSGGPDPNKLGQAIAAAVQRELVAQKAPGGILSKYGA